MQPVRLAALAAAFLASTALVPANAEVFNRIATFNVVDNLPADADSEKPTVSEIIAGTEDGMTLVYTDSPGERVGMIDIADPASPAPAGTVALGGEPTSVVVVGGKALVGVVTSESYTNPSGNVAVVDMASKAVDSTCDIGGQPDSLALSPDKTFLAVVIENERDEEVNDGAIPQLPGGNLTVFSIDADGLDCGSKKLVDLTGIAEVAPDDPEPEYVDINGLNQAVITLQENNHIAIVDLGSGEVIKHFAAGAVDIDQIDTVGDGAIALNSSLSGVLREPDAVQWIDNDRFVTADEGDWNGGSRSFTIFNKNGEVAYASGNTVEHIAARLGHYPEGRSENKGSEPEGAEVATYGDNKLIFVGLERASLVLVYKDADGDPEYLQALTGGIGPEGLLAIPERGLLVTASETDLREDGLIGSVVTIYRYEDGDPAYPTIASANDADGKPIPWMALSGAAGDPSDTGKLYVVSDSASSAALIFTVDTTQTLAVITDVVTVTKDGAPATLLDLEGIAIASDGGFWLTSEGNPEREENPTQSTLLKVDANGAIVEEVAMPEALAAQAVRFGFEGVAATGSGDDETVWLAVQREWKDDPKGMVKLLAYKPAAKEWTAVHYPLDTPEKGWMGLSEITAYNGGLIVVERDNQVGDNAKVKQITYVSLDGVTPAPLGGDIPVVEKTVIRDLIADLAAPHGFVLDKIESFAIGADGNAYVITDNDGVDDHSGETLFIRLGKIQLPM
jgi:hypothetical protein